MSSNDPPGLDPDGGDDNVEGRAPGPHSITTPTSPRSHVAEMDDLSERFSQQQVMISQLKEMVMAEEAARSQKIASSRLKMEKCVSQLARIRDRAKGSRLKSDTPDSSVRSTPSMSLEPDISGRSSVASSTDISLQTSSSIVTSTTTTLTTTASVVQSGTIKSGDSTTKLKTPSREVTKMLHKQIQGHKAKIAKTAQHEKELEEALAKIQKQLEENQSQTAEMLQLGQPKPKVLLPSFILEESNSESNKIISELKSRITQLEGTVLDLQETCKEKDSVIDSKTKAITLMSADLSKKGKNTLDLLDDTKEQMQHMQQNFASMESQMNEEKQKLVDELETCKNRIFYLEEANSILETERFNLSVQNSFLEEQLAEKEKEINTMKEEMIENMKNIEQLTLKVDKSIETDVAHEEKGSKEISEMNALSEKIEILEKLNATLRQSNIELQEKLSPIVTAAPIVKEVVSKPTESPKSKKKTQPKPKGSQKYKNLNPKTESPPKETSSPEKDSSKEMQETIDRLQIVIETLNKQVLEKEILLSQKESESKEIKEASIDSSVDESQSEPLLIESTDSQIIKSEISHVSADPVAESDSDETKTKSIEAQLEDALKEIEKLTLQLVEANKSMIKVKAAHKKELKQMQKSIDDFSKVSNTNSEVIKLQSEVSLLTQKIAELEDEKGNLQLHLVDYDSGRVSDSQLHAKLMETETLAEERLKAIAELETQKFDLVQELHSVKQQIIALEDKVADLSFLENEHVSTELKSAQLEEQLDILENKNKDALNEIERLKSEKDGIVATVEALNKEKTELNNKLEMYIQENMDLIEKLDKLSAEKVSSAESIEMVESLTSQEKMEIEQYQKGIEGSHMDKAKTRDEVEESLRRNSFSHSTHVENADLPSNIDIINQERHEFMEKLDSLKIENSGLSLKMEELLNEKKALEDYLESLKSESNNFTVVLNEEKSKYDNLMSEIDALKQENNNLSELVKTLSSNKEVKTEEAIVSETVEVECVAEKEIQPVSSSQTEAVSSPSKAKSNKNQTKEILRLKNLVKQQESEIERLKGQLTELKETASVVRDEPSDQQTSSAELDEAIQKNKVLNDELLQLKTEKDSYTEQLARIENSYTETFNDRQRLYEHVEHLEQEIKELQNKLKVNDGITANLKVTVDQHKSDMDVLNNIMQNKDDEIAQYKSDIEQLDAVSRKLKSTLSQIEDEKSASINSVDKIKELENSLTKSNTAVQENESKIKELETKIEESVKYVEMLKAKIVEYESTVSKTNDEVESTKLQIKSLDNEKEEIRKEVLRWKDDCATKDEEINEIKLQLRKESIAHDEVINNLKSVEENNSILSAKLAEMEKACDDYKSDTLKQKEEFDVLDKKSKEQFEKLKKFAANFKKKSALCTELETQIESLKNDVQQYVFQLEEANLKYQQVFQELSVVNSQFGVVQSQLQQTSSTSETKEVLEKQVSAMQNQIYELQSQIKQYEIEIQTQSATNNQLSQDILKSDSEISALKEENNLVRNELQVKNEEISRLLHLEKELDEKQSTIDNLTELIDETKSLYNQFKCGQEAKLQEKDIYIESLESEIVKHKDRIVRLEDSVSTMEERRASLERKTDNLVTKLHEKDAKYSESSNHEDELERRLAALIEHDEFIQKQLEDTQHENVDLVEKLNGLSESNTAMRSELDAVRVEINTSRNNLSHLQTLEEERINLNERVSYLEIELKRVSSESTEIIKQKTKEYEYLESELHSLMSNTEIQRRQSKEQFDKLQDELSAQSHVLKELQQENDWLKAENETIALQKDRVDKQQDVVPQIDFVQFGDTKPSNENNAKIRELTELLEEKEKHINTLSIQLQFASSGSTSDVLSGDSNSHLVKELQSALIQKNQEIEHINSQFQSCLTQLTDTIESEKTLKQTVTDLSKEINFKIDMINRLEEEIAELKTSVEQFKNFVPTVEPICQTSIVQVAASKKVDPKHKEIPSGSNLQPDALKALEDQIIPSDTQDSAVMSEIEKKMIRNFVHDPPEKVSGDLKTYFQSSGQAEEEFLKPKKAFLCFDEDSEKAVTENPFDEEDGWGWGNQETVIDEQQMQTSDSNVRIDELERLIQTLTEEKNKLTTDLQQSQQKTTKALLKLKEFKNRNEALSNEVKNLKLSSDFNLLDNAIQDELASQVKTLEEKIKELSSEGAKEKFEREHLLKRIDVLTSANERLTEMKEKQDIEMQICRNQNKGLSEKLKNLDWDNSFAEETTPPAVVEEIETVSDPQDVSNVKDIIELIKKIQDLEADNEELQAFIEDQQTKLNQFKTIEVDYEKLKNQYAFEVSELQQESDSLKQKLIDMNKKCDDLESVIDQLNVDSNRKSEISDDSNNLKEEIKDLQDKVNNLTSELSSKNDSLRHFEDVKNLNVQLQTKFDDLNLSYNCLVAELQKLKEQSDARIMELQNENGALKLSVSDVSGLQNNLQLLSDENVALNRQLESVLGQSNQQAETEVVDLRSKLEALVKEYYEFQEKFNEMASEKDRIEMDYNNIVIEKDKLDVLYKDVSEQEAACKTELIKLSYEKDELTEKYDKLLNKLGEKNMSEETEQAIIFTDKLNNLTQELNTKNADIIELNRKVEQYETEKISLQTSLSKLQEENYGLINDLSELRNNVNAAVDQRGMEVAEVWKQHVAMREAEFMNMEQSLRQELNVLQSQIVSDGLQTKETPQVVQQVSIAKSEEFGRLKRKLEDVVMNLEATKRQFEVVVSESAENKELYETRLVQWQEKCNEIQKERDCEKLQNVENSHKIVSLMNELDNIRTLCHNIQASSEANVGQSDYYKTVIDAKDKELQDCAIRIQQLTDIYNVKFNDMEIALVNKHAETDNVRQQLYVAENKLSDSVHEHEAELAEMRLQLHAERTQYDQIISELKDKAEKLEIQLETKINECRSLNMKIESMIEGENARLNDLKKALESQEIEIVTLKENLTEQADTYEKLMVSQMQEIHKLRTNRHVSFSEETKPGADIEEPATSSDTKDDNPARAELDLAMYMLHQRDVRCEELTMELTQLLEERDTLQLKLSNALRANEAMRSKVNPSEIKHLESAENVEERSKSNIEDVHRSKEKSLPPAGVEIGQGETSSSESDKSLETKLSQLHKVGHMRDIRLRDEREHRMRQMELLQRDLQHLPPEAAARLREAHYTLTRDTQSASTVLLNWLWGKTTPKVVHM